jgi:hypothetical protein
MFTGAVRVKFMGDVGYLEFLDGWIALSALKILIREGQGYRPITHSEWYCYLVLEKLELITSSGVFVSGFRRQSELGYKLATCWGVYPRCPG